MWDLFVVGIDESLMFCMGERKKRNGLERSQGAYIFTCGREFSRAKLSRPMTRTVVTSDYRAV